MLIRHSILYLVGRAIPAGVGLLALALYTRLLSPEQYGLYALVVAAMSMLNAVLFHWLSLSVSRVLPASQDQPQVVLSAALKAFLGLLFLSGLLGAVLASVWPDDGLRGIILLTIVLTWGQAWFDLNLQIANAGLKPVRYGMVSSLKALVALGAGLGLFYLGLGVTGILAGLMIGLLVSSALGWSHWRGCSLRGHEPQLLRELVAYGAPLALTLIFVLIVGVSDRFILGWLIGPDAVGGYAAAYDLAQQSLGLLTGVVHLAAFPLVVRALEERGVAEARAQLHTNGYMLLAIALPATVGLVMLSSNISTVMLGSEFRESAGVIMSWVALAIFVGTLKSYYLDYSFQLGRRVRKQVWTVGIAAITNVILNLLLIPIHGPLGAAYATLAAFVVGFSISWYLGRRIFPLPLPRQVYKPLLASCGMAAVLWPTMSWRSGQDLVMQVAIGACAYTLSLLALNLTRRTPGRIATFFSE